MTVSGEWIDNVLPRSYELYAKIRDEHSKNKDYHSDEYLQFFSNLMNIDACSVA